MASCRHGLVAKRQRPYSKLHPRDGSPGREGMTPALRRSGGSRQHGFTLLELTIALLLLALMSGVLFGSLKLSANSWDKGEARTERSNEMRLTEEFLRK